MSPQEVVSQAPRLAAFIASSAINVPTAETSRDRARGVLLGLAVGNLLGLPVEGAPYDHIADSHPNGLTEIDPREANRPLDDDLAQAVDLGDALLGNVDYARDFADRLIDWALDNGRGMGITTGEVIDELATGKPLPEPARLVFELRDRIAPNGGVMRCAPVAVARRNNPNLLITDSALTCVVTHYAPACQWSCIIVNATIAVLLNGGEPNLAELMRAVYADGCPDLQAIAHIDRIPAAILDAIAEGEPPPAGIDWLLCDHRLIGHTLLALQVGLWAAVTPLDFQHALIASVAAGGDTDTNAAVAGAVLGARYGASSIPERWLACVPQRERIERLATALLESGGG